MFLNSLVEKIYISLKKYIQKEEKYKRSCNIERELLQNGTFLQ